MCMQTPYMAKWLSVSYLYLCISLFLCQRGKKNISCVCRCMQAWTPWDGGLSFNLTLRWWSANLRVLLPTAPMAPETQMGVLPRPLFMWVLRTWTQHLLTAQQVLFPHWAISPEEKNMLTLKVPRERLFIILYHGFPFKVCILKRHTEKKGKKSSEASHTLKGISTSTYK